MIELAVLDMAGTTVRDDGGVADSFRAALGAVDVPVSIAEANAVMGLPKPAAVRMLLEKAGRTPTPEEVAEVHEDFVRRMIAYYRESPGIGAFPGATDAFRTLRGAGVKVGLNTGFGSDIVDALFDRLGWAIPATIDAVVSSDRVPRGRPHADMVQYLMRELGVSDPMRVAKVGDTAADLGEGQSAGCALNIGVTTGAYSAAELRRCPHTHVVDSLAEAVDLICNFGAK